MVLRRSSCSGGPPSLQPLVRGDDDLVVASGGALDDGCVAAIEDSGGDEGACFAGDRRPGHRQVLAHPAAQLVDPALKACQLGPKVHGGTGGRWRAGEPRA
ncbi:MAG: hypothetical protein M0T80_08595 [Actinomycetota bacterium]|nr:hypothetical protein [Actinomycetota bacterium]